VKVGLNFFPVSPRLLLPVAQRADELGYESVWLGEHVALPATIDSRHPYYPELGPPLPSTVLHDPLIALSYVAAQTRQLKLGTGIYILALRHPIVAARLIATLDIFSGGRALIGVGVGWIKEEFEVLDIPWEHRGSRMEEAIAVIRRLWTEERIAHDGRFYNFDEIGSEPKPVNGTVPILIGGENDIAVRRAARIGDGWTGMTPTPEDAAARVKLFRELGAGQERPFEITVAAEGVPSLDEFRRFRDTGVDRLTVVARLLSGGGKTVEAMLVGLTRFAEEFMLRADD
jgi:probable F420-dependent oxidoreductase